MTPSRLRTIFLTERVATEVGLARRDLDYLLAEHATHLTLAPGARPGRYRATAGGYVGTIGAPSCRLVIRPKVPLANFFHLLTPEQPIRLDWTGAAEPGWEAFNFLAAQLAALLEERAREGFHRGYASRTEEGAVVRGRLDMLAQSRATPARKNRMLSCFDELTADIPCNQIPKANAQGVAGSPFVVPAIRAKLSELVSVMADISAPDTNVQEVIPPSGHGYHSLLAICKLLDQSLSKSGRTLRPRLPAFPTFLVDMDRLFERYVTRAVQMAFAGQPGFVVYVQPGHRLAGQGGEAADVLLRPDVVVERGGQPYLVVDAKWKSEEPGVMAPTDVHQAIAYAAALGAPRVALVYPGEKNDRCFYRVRQRPAQLEVYRLCVVGTPLACQRGLRRLGRTLRPSGGRRKVDSTA